MFNKQNQLKFYNYSKKFSTFHYAIIYCKIYLLSLSFESLFYHFKVLKYVLFGAQKVHALIHVHAQ